MHSQTWQDSVCLNNEKWLFFNRSSSLSNCRTRSFEEKYFSSSCPSSTTSRDVCRQVSCDQVNTFTEVEPIQARNISRTEASNLFSLLEGKWALTFELKNLVFFCHVTVVAMWQLLPCDSCLLFNIRRLHFQSHKQLTGNDVELVNWADPALFHLQCCHAWRFCFAVFGTCKECALQKFQCLSFIFPTLKIFLAICAPFCPLLPLPKHIFW